MKAKLLVICVVLMMVLNINGVFAKTNEVPDDPGDGEVIIQTVFPELEGSNTKKIKSGAGYYLVSVVDYTYQYDDYIGASLFRDYYQPDVYLRESLLTTWEPTYVECHTINGGRDMKVTVRGRVMGEIGYEGNTARVTLAYINTSYTFKP